MRRSCIPIIAAVAAIAAAPVLVPAAWSQGAPEQKPPARQQPSQSFSEPEIKAFAGALKDVQEIGREYTPRLEKAETPDQQLAVRKEAQDKMVKAVEDKGLSVDKYNQIADAARGDPEVAAKVRQFMGTPESDGARPKN